MRACATPASQLPFTSCTYYACWDSMILCSRSSCRGTTYYSCMIGNLIIPHTCLI